MVQKRLLIMVISLALAILPMMAQTDEAKEINRIKLSKDFLYAETTMKDEAEALSGARAILEMTVADWMASQKKGENADAYIVQAKQHFTPINTMRGQYHRVFLYVKKSDIVPVGVGGGTMVVQPKTANTSAEADSQQFSEFPVVSQSNPDVAVVTSIDELKSAITLTPEEKQLAAIMRFEEVEGLVTALEEAGHVTAYGKKKTMPAEGVCHMLVYNRDGGIVAVLRREANGQLMNLRSLQEDNVQNYPDCGAIWLQLK